MKKSKRIITFLTALVLILTLAVLSGAVRAEVTDKAYGFDSYKPILGDADLLYRPAFVPDPTAVMQTTLQPTGMRLLILSIRHGSHPIQSSHMSIIRSPGQDPDTPTIGLITAQNTV